MAFKRMTPVVVSSLPPQTPDDEFLALGMDGEDQVGPVVHGDLGF